MRERKTAAIILHSVDVFDADRSYLLFTREFGKVWARARGVRKTTSRLTGHLLSYVPTDLELVEAGNGYLIVQAQVSGGQSVEQYPEHTLLFLQYTEVLSEAVDKLFIDREPHPEVYDGLIYSLERLHTRCQDPEPNQAKLQLIVAELLFKMLSVLGYHPELNQCAVTGDPLTENWLGWSSVIGGVICESAPTQSQFPFIRLDHSRTVVVLRQLARPEFIGERLSVDDDIKAETARVIFDYLQTQIGKPLKSLRFITG